MTDSDDYEAVREMLDQSDWQKLYPRLVAYASNRLRLLTWRNGVPPGGQEAQDLVQEAIAQVFRGQRRWNPEKRPDLAKFLMDTIKSLSNHLAHSKDNTTREKQSDGDGQERRDEADSATYHDPGEHIDLERAKESFRRAVAGAEEEEIILEYLMDGVKPGEIAKDLGVPPQKAYAVIRETRRKMREQCGRPAHKEE